MLGRRCGLPDHRIKLISAAAASAASPWYRYSGDVWERSGLSNAIRSLVMLGITAASNKPAEFRVHAKGALANGCTRAQVQDVLLLVAMYCGVPAAIETNRIAAEIFGETSASEP
jgi:4-carboxymuconolactone decarboxylase